MNDRPADRPDEPRSRASVRGKGWEILRGGVPPVESVPAVQEGAVPPETSGEPEAPTLSPEQRAEDEAVLDWMAAPELSKLTVSRKPAPEAGEAALPVEEGEPGGPVDATTALPASGAEAEYEALPSVEALVKDRPLPPRYETRPEVEALVPPGPETMGDAGLSAEDAGATVLETGQAAEAGFAVQPMGGVLDFPEGDAPIIRPQDARIDAGRLAPVTPRLPVRDLFGDAQDVRPDDELLDRFVTDERLEKLWGELEALQDRLVEQVQGDRRLTDVYQKELLQASALLLQDRANYDDVRAIFYRVRADLAREEKVSREIARYKPQLLLYLFLAFVLWLVLMAIEPLFRQFIIGLGLEPFALMYHPTLFGMLGAIVNAYFTLNKHAIRLRDFDASHVSWYLMNPLVGLIMGLLMALVFATGIVSTMNVGVLEQPEVLGQYPFLLWVLCFLAGYNQNVVLRLLDRTFSLLRGSGESEAGDEEDAVERRSSSPPSPPAA